MTKSKLAAGILMYRVRDAVLEVLLAHPGGPYWVRKDDGAWSIPKGEFEQGEDPLENAIREFEEETGTKPRGKFIPLTPLKQRSGKIIHAFAVAGDLDPNGITSNLFEMEWPPRSGKKIEVPEVDRVGWFTTEVARKKIIPGQAGFINELMRLL
jgi:predicted NUDIX family NTP pyrophosphohydrolase